MNPKRKGELRGIANQLQANEPVAWLFPSGVGSVLHELLDALDATEKERDKWLRRANEARELLATENKGRQKLEERIRRLRDGLLLVNLESFGIARGCVDEVLDADDLASKDVGG